MVQAKQHFIETLYYRVNKLVTVDKDKINTSIFGATMMSIITDSHTLDEKIAQMPVEKLVEYLYHWMIASLIQKILAKAIQRAVRGSYRLGRVMKDSIDYVFAVYSAEIGTYKKLISDLDKSISRIVSTLPEEKVLESIPGIGKVYSAGIIAEIGSIDRLDTKAIWIIQQRAYTPFEDWQQVPKILLG